MPDHEERIRENEALIAEYEAKTKAYEAEFLHRLGVTDPKLMLKLKILAGVLVVGGVLIGLSFLVHALS